MRTLGEDFDSIDEAQRWVLERILRSGVPSSPRGQRTREILAASFSINKPRRRCVTNLARRWSLPLALGEFCWHIAGSDDLSFIAHYGPRWREYSDDNLAVGGSCYGKRIFGHLPSERSQWDMLVQLLRHDPMSRRAVLYFQQKPVDALRNDSKDVACATTLQFFWRADALHAIAYMRSNDAIWGLPYDVFLFTMIQEMLAAAIGAEMGTYHHVAGSLHLYEKQSVLAEEILACAESPQYEMPRIGPLSELDEFVRREAAIRKGGVSIEGASLDSYWEGLLHVLRLFSAVKTASSEDIRALIDISPYAAVLNPYFYKAVNKTAAATIVSA